MPSFQKQSDSGLKACFRASSSADQEAYLCLYPHNDVYQQQLGPKTAESYFVKRIDDCKSIIVYHHCTKRTARDLSRTKAFSAYANRTGRGNELGWKTLCLSIMLKSRFSEVGQREMVQFSIRSSVDKFIIFSRSCMSFIYSVTKPPTAYDFGVVFLFANPILPLPISNTANCAFRKTSPTIANPIPSEDWMPP